MAKLSSFDEPLLVSWVFCPFLWLLVINLQFFFVVEGFFEEPRQIVHLGVVQGRVWFTSSKMLHRKYIENYCMSSISKFTIGIDALHNIRGVETFPYIVGDSTYPICPYLLKNFKPWNPTLEMDKIWFDQLMNWGHVSIENSFRILKNCWRIFWSLTMKIDNGPPPPLLWHVVFYTTIVDWWAWMPLDMIMWRESRIW